MASRHEYASQINNVPSGMVSIGLLLMGVLFNMHVAQAEGTHPHGEPTVERIVIEEAISLRLQGKLEQAGMLIEQAISDPASTPADRVALHLELARIHDRIGLHHNSRPVAAALKQLEQARALSGGLGAAASAAIELGFADYHYRAEMQARKFTVAEAHARRAIDQFAAIGDGHGHADAVHRLGLIEMQRGELEKARQLFDRSLQLDETAGARLVFRGEYERHVGFVLYLSGEVLASVPYFRRSLDARQKAGAVDTAIFASQSLASVLYELDKPAEALAHAQYAFETAASIGSPVGRSRSGLVLGRIYRDLGEPEMARSVLESTIESARSVGYASVLEQAISDLAGL